MAEPLQRGAIKRTNMKAVLQDILGHGNEDCLLPGQLEARWAERVDQAGGLLFSSAEIEAFNEIAEECGMEKWSLDAFSKEKENQR